MAAAPKGQAHRARALAALAAWLAPAGLLAAPGAEGGLPGSIVYGGDASFPPYEFLDASGQPAGLNVDLIRAVGRARGLEVRVELRPWSEVRRGLQQGELDVAAMYRSPSRAREVDFGIAHELVYHEVFVRRGGPPLRSLSDLAGRTVLVEADAYAADALPALGVGARLRPLPSEPAALEALARGEGDAAVVTQAVGRPFQSRKALGEAIAPTGPPVLLAEYAFVTRSGRPRLLEELNEGVAQVKASGEYERIYDRWVRPDRSAERVRQAGWALAVALAAVVLVAGWNWSLRRRVAAQTEALRRELAAVGAAQAALAESERARRQLQKVEAVGRLAGGVAHDFNNVLGVIVSYATFVRERLAELAEDAGDADEILGAAERATRLTRQLLAFSRATPMEVRPVDLVALVESLLGMLRRLVGEHIEVLSALAPEPVVVEADASQLEQVLINLAANARDAMPRGGRLSVSVSARPGDPGMPGLAVLAVTDTGTGMDEAVQGSIFEPFFTTKGPGHGTGLGLATVHANVEKLGGRIEVRSAPGEGSTFTVLLPRSARREEPAPPAAAPATRAGAETILVVEDDPALRRAARLALERAGHRVVEAGDGEEGAAAAARTPELTLVVTDVVLPRRSGPELVAGLRAGRPSLRVLYLSGYVQEGSRLDLGAPGTAFLMKPCSPQALVDAVVRLSAR